MRRKSPPGADLTPREREVLDLVRRGLSNEEIARCLDVSVAGVKYHVSEILGKLGLENRHDAARWAAVTSQQRRPSWAGALAPLGVLWRRLVPNLGRAANIAGIAVAGGALMAVGALAALLIIASDGNEGSLDVRAHPNVLVALATDRMAAAESYRATYTFTPDATRTSADDAGVPIDTWILEWERPHTFRLYEDTFLDDACRLARLPDHCFPDLREVIYQDGTQAYSRRCFGVEDGCNPWLPRSAARVAEGAKYPPDLALVALELGNGYAARPTGDGWHLRGVVNYERVGDESWRRFEGAEGKVDQYCAPGTEDQCIDVDSYDEYVFLKQAHGEYAAAHSRMDVWLAGDGTIERFELRIERGLERYEDWCVDFCWHSAHPGTLTVEYAHVDEIDIEPPRQADLAY